MATKRMFSKQITESDAFLDMPVSSQLLYFHLNMGADDDGFVANPKRIMRMVSAVDDDLKVLLGKRFLLSFENGVVVIKHWLLHNAVRKDMYKETQYIEEKKMLQIKENNVYTEVRNEYVTLPLHRIGKDRLDQVRLGKDREEIIPKKTKDFILEVKKITDSLKDINSGEVEKFCSYWTEPNKSKTKIRWELQPTFDIYRRLGTWFRNNDNFNKTKQRNIKNL